MIRGLSATLAAGLSLIALVLLVTRVIVAVHSDAGGPVSGWIEPRLVPWVERLRDAGLEADRFRLGWSGWDPVFEADVVRWRPSARAPSERAGSGTSPNAPVVDAPADAAAAFAIAAVQVSGLRLRVDTVASLRHRQLVLKAIELDGLRVTSRGDLPADGVLAALLDRDAETRWLDWSLPAEAWGALRRFALDARGPVPARFVIDDLEWVHRGLFGDRVVEERVTVERVVGVRERVAGRARMALRIDARWWAGGARSGAQAIPRLDARLRLAIDARERLDADLRLVSVAPVETWQDVAAYLLGERAVARVATLGVEGSPGDAGAARGWRVDAFARWDARALQRLQVHVDQARPGALAQRWKARVQPPDGPATRLPRVIELVGEGGRARSPIGAPLTPRIRWTHEAALARVEVGDVDLAALWADAAAVAAATARLGIDGDALDRLVAETSIPEGLLASASAARALGRSRPWAGQIEQAGVIAALPAPEPSPAADRPRGVRVPAAATECRASLRATDAVVDADFAEGDGAGADETPRAGGCRERLAADRTDSLRPESEGAWTDLLSRIDRVWLSGRALTLTVPAAWWPDGADARRALEGLATPQASSLGDETPTAAPPPSPWPGGSQPSQDADDLRLPPISIDVVAGPRRWGVDQTMTDAPAQAGTPAGGTTLAAALALRVDGGTVVWPVAWRDRAFRDDWPVTRAAVEAIAELDLPVRGGRAGRVEGRFASGDDVSGGVGSVDPESEWQGLAWRLAVPRFEWVSDDLSLNGALRGSSAPPAGAAAPAPAGAHSGSDAARSAGGAAPSDAESPYESRYPVPQRPSDAPSWTASGETRTARRAGVWSVRVDVERANVAAIGRYLPGVAPRETSAWLRRALRGGEARGGRLTFDGDPLAWARTLGRRAADAPASGRFQARVPLHDVRLDYRRGWPVAEDVSGLLVFDDERFAIEAAAGRLGGEDETGRALDARAVRAEVANMIVAPYLTIEGDIEGPAHAIWRALDDTGTLALVGADALGLIVEGDVSGQLRLAAALDDDEPLPPLNASRAALDTATFGVPVTPLSAVGGREIRIAADVRLRRGQVAVGAADLSFENVDARFLIRPDGGLSIAAGRGTLNGEVLSLVSPEFGSPPTGPLDAWLEARLDGALDAHAVDRARAPGSTRIRIAGRQRLDDWWSRIPEPARPALLAAFGESARSRPRHAGVTLAFPFELADGPDDEARPRPWGLAADIEWHPDDWRLPLPAPPSGASLALRYAAPGVARDAAGRLLPAADAAERIDAQLRLRVPERFDLQLRLADGAPNAAGGEAGPVLTAARLHLFDARAIDGVSSGPPAPAQPAGAPDSGATRAPLGLGEWQLIAARFDLDAWTRWLRESGLSSAPRMRSERRDQGRAPPPRDGDSGNVSTALPLTAVRVDVADSLQWLERDWGALRAELWPAGGAASAQASGRSRYTLRLGGQRLVGDLTVDAPTVAGSGVDLARVDEWRVFGRLARAWMPLAFDRERLVGGASSAPASRGPPDAVGTARLPEVTLSIDDLRFGDLGLVNVELAGRRSDAHGGDASGEAGPVMAVQPATASAQRPLWRLERLRARLPEGDVELIADGWSWEDGQGVASSVRARLFGDDWGGALAAANLTDALAGGRGEAVVEAHWRGALWAPERRSLSGGFELEIGDGAFRAIEPGAGRLLGLVSLDALSSRLRLDFRDVFDEGYAFRRAAGLGQISDGVLSIESLGIIGPAAAVRIDGRADLVSGALDQRVFVVPAIRTGIPVVGAILGGPLGAVAGLVADRALNLGTVIEEAARLEYRVTGVIANPVIEPVRRAPEPE